MGAGVSPQAFFDLNGTLFDTAAMAGPLGGEQADERLITEALSDAITLAMVETITGSYRDLPELLGAALRPRLEREGRAEQLDAVLAAAAEMQPRPDAASAIATLRGAGYRVGVLTNSSTAFAEQLLDRAELDLSPVVGSEQVGAFKPDRRLYERGLAVAGAEASETVLISAHWWDALGAKRAGLLAGWSAQKEGRRVDAEPEPDFTGEDLAAVAQAIARGRD